MTDARFMSLALALGRRGLGNTWPNPAVGCVIVKGSRIVGRGWTQPGGRPHAEVGALRQAGASARGATAYVSLEPCSHHGESPPCADALVDAGVSRVVAAVQDPDPRVNGAGLVRLTHAGIDVELGVLEAEARRDLKGFLLRATVGRPMLTLKLAASLDGRIAMANGESQWITGPEARRHVHAQRLRHDAVMIGAGTARADDPVLTVRGLGAKHQPVRVVLSSDLKLPLDGKLALSAQDVPLWLVHTGQAEPELVSAWQAIGAKTFLVSEHLGAIDLSATMKVLADEGLTRIFCEGGARLAASLLTAGLVDEFVSYSAGMVIGADGLAAITKVGLSHLADVPRFSLIEVRRIGEDVFQRWERGES